MSIILWVMTVALSTACELHPAGEFTLSGWAPPPSPNRFTQSIHPRLVESCAAAACHGRKTTFTLHEAPTWNGPPVETALQLPEPYRQDYFLVLAFSNPIDQDRSEILLWGTGQVKEHPGGAALSRAQAGEILDWLEGQP